MHAIVKCFYLTEVEEKTTKNIINNIEKMRESTSFLDTPIESKICFLFILFSYEFAIGSFLRRTLPNISRSANQQSRQKMTGHSIEALVSNLHHRPCKPVRSVRSSNTEWYCSENGDTKIDTTGDDEDTRMEFIDDDNSNNFKQTMGKMSKL